MMRKTIAAAAVLGALMTTEGAQAETPLRPGMSIHIELPGALNPDPLADKTKPFQNSCTLSFLYQVTLPAPPAGEPAKPDRPAKPKPKPKKAKKSGAKNARKGGKGKRTRRSASRKRASVDTPTGRVVQYATTAGHCLLTDAAATEQVHAAGTGPVISLSQRSAAGHIVPGPRIGRVIYAANQFPVLYPDDNVPDFIDIGIIELDPGVATNPAMCHFGGPTGLREDPLDAPERVFLYGQGNATGLHRETGTTLLPGRSGFGASAGHPNLVTGTYPLSGGDSGSPITDAQGRALALVTSNAHQPRIAVSMPRAKEVLGLDLQLRTAPVVRDATPVGTDAGCVPPPVTGG